MFVAIGWVVVLGSVLGSFLGEGGHVAALLQPFDAKGREFMSYIVQHGTFFDVPAKFVIGEMRRLYPKLCQPGGLRGNMEDEGGKR